MKKKYRYRKIKQSSTKNYLSVDFAFVKLTIILLVLLQLGCKKFVEVSTPATATTGASVYNNNSTAIAVLTGIYTDMSLKGYLEAGGFTTISTLAGLSSDELELYNGASDAFLIAHYKNSLSPNTTAGQSWDNVYPYIFICNSAIEGFEGSTNLAPAIRQQLLGEAKFMRAFFYFYLVNLYGDVPLVITTNYKVNSQLIRASKSKVYEQIIDDLKDAQGLISNVYLDGSIIKNTSERVRPNKWTATALLSRVFLYTNEYANAESEASRIIDNTSTFILGTLDNATLDNAFLKNSKEAIWQLQPVTSGYNTRDAELYILSSVPNSFNPLFLSKNLLNSFEPGDQRKVKWIGKYTDTVTNPNVNYFYPYKYKVNTIDAPVSEYLTMLRLGEQYLIRAEARAQQNNINDARNDLNSIRTRAGLPNKTTTDKTSLLSEIQHERQVELFTELGHRWLDLKRTNTVGLIMDAAAVQKGGIWRSYQALYPIPQYDIDKNPNLIQNSGY
jgi:starch-binding outer membrane protein, SusD/RagB family